jgi:zinc protease
VGHTGSTHLLEHMLFKGTPTFNKERRTQVAATLQRVGADFNATTWYDRTNYFETVPSDALELAVHLEADRMRNSFIADEDRRSEMTVVRNELERGQNEPMMVLDEAVYATAFREHPYHHPTIGWRSDVENVPTARLKEFYDTFYHPNNATVIVVGDFEEPRALELILTYFGAVPASPSPIPEVYTDEPGSRASAASSCAARASFRSCRSRSARPPRSGTNACSRTRSLRDAPPRRPKRTTYSRSPFSRRCSRTA